MPSLAPEYQARALYVCVIRAAFSEVSLGPSIFRLQSIRLTNNHGAILDDVSVGLSSFCKVHLSHYSFRDSVNLDKKEYGQLGKQKEFFFSEWPSDYMYKRLKVPSWSQDSIDAVR